MISEVCHYLNTTEKEFRPSGRISVNILKNKQHELFKVNVLLRKDSLRLRWKWTEKVGRGDILILLNMKPNQQLESQRLKFFQAN